MNVLRGCSKVLRLGLNCRTCVLSVQLQPGLLQPGPAEPPGLHALLLLPALLRVRQRRGVQHQLHLLLLQQRYDASAEASVMMMPVLKLML